MAERFRKRPVEIEAMRVTDRNGAEVEVWCGGESYDVAMAPGQTHHVDIKTLEGTMRADVGDYVIKGVQGEFYPCKPDIFRATYEAADDGAAPISAPEIRELLLTKGVDAAQEAALNRHDAHEGLESIWREKFERDLNVALEAAGFGAEG
jgi:hypothetical protein